MLLIGPYALIRINREQVRLVSVIPVDFSIDEDLGWLHVFIHALPLLSMHGGLKHRANRKQFLLPHVLALLGGDSLLKSDRNFLWVRRLSDELLNI